MNLSDIDLKLLKIFHAVVEAGGYANAQAGLNLSLSTISSHMTKLEGRLGFRLCERGRGGFALTTKGEVFYRQMLDFLGAVQLLETNAKNLRNNIIGELTLGMIDNLITDSACPLPAALSRFFQLPNYRFHLSVHVLSPQELEKGVLERRLDLAVGIFYQRKPGLDYRPLYRERDVLVCSQSHPLARVTDPHEIAQLVPGAPKVVRNFMLAQEFPFIDDHDDSIIAAVSSVEAVAMMILNGPFIGCLPQHYAERWLDTGQLVALLPDKFVRYSQISLVTRDQGSPHSAILTSFLSCLERGLEEASPVAHD
ncbi:MAG: LysR family transcriptional regulator [Pseudoalteromonas distincta]